MLAFAGQAIDLPHDQERGPKVLALVDAMRRADGIVIVSAAYHGTISGMLKNALDYAQDLADVERPYFEAKPIGLVAIAAGWQATGSTLATLRPIAHALRGWPTPLGVTTNTTQSLFDRDGEISNLEVLRSLEILTGQLLSFAPTACKATP